MEIPHKITLREGQVIYRPTCPIRSELNKIKIDVSTGEIKELDVCPHYIRAKIISLSEAVAWFRE
jgi:hypothetical protein